jgi:hypothetical protein
MEQLPGELHRSGWAVQAVQRTLSIPAFGETASVGGLVARCGATPVDKLTHYRRFEVPKGRQLKRVVEFSHSIDSLRHPLIQLSDLVIYTTRKFLECDNGYRPNWSDEAKNFFASCYDRVQTRMWRTNLIDVEGKEEQEAHALLKLCQSTHNGHWKRHYTLPDRR